MDAIAWIGAGVFIFGYVLIALEQKFNTHKSAIALIMAGILWILAAIVGNGTEEFTHITNETAINVFSVVIFSLASMALIEILAHYKFFDWVRQQLLRLKIRDRGQFILLMAMCFMLSGVLDNISLTISMILVARRFFTGKNLILMAAGVVIASNAGGAWSVVGDVTSLLLWFADKVTPLGLIASAFIPTAVLTVVAGFFLYRQLDPTNFTKHEGDEKIELSLSEKIIIGSALAAFLLPLVVNAIGVQPYVGRLFGLGITWALIELFKSRKANLPSKSHMSANIEKIIQTVDISSIKFLTGILLSVGALTSLGVLAYLSQVAVGDAPSESWLITLGSMLGLLSGVVDNSALVAIAIQVFPVDNPQIWGLIAITTGTGGSLLIFASAAGIVAMGALKELTFQAYLKMATLPALAGLVAAILVWFLQYNLFYK